MKRKSIEDENSNVNNHVTNYTSGSNDDAVMKLKENLRLQAIELASLRQETLSKRLQSNKEIDSLREQLDLARREVIKVNAIARTHKGDKELKMNEMALTIKTLSSRGDMHTQLVAARQELEAEKVTCHHLRADIDVYRAMIETEQTKAVAIRKDLATVASTLEAVNVLQTIMDVPGVEPSALIEAMSGQIIQLHADYSKTRSLLASSTSQVASLQRALANTNGKRSINGGVVNDKSIDMTPKTTRTYDPSDVFSRTNTLGIDTDINANMTFVVDGDMSPHKVLDTLDSALLSQKVLELESIIAELRANVNDAHDEIIKNENSRIQEREEYEAVGRIEVESSIKRQEILQLTLDDAKVKISSLRQRCSDLEKTIIDMKANQEMPVLDTNINDNENDFDITRDNNDTISTSNTQENDHNEELEATKKLLLERTTQLKIMMDSLDAFHTSGIRTDNDYSELGNIGLTDLAAGPLPSSSSTWGIQALVKRVVELTTDLTSQTAAASMEERKANQFENDNRKRKSDVIKLKVTITTITININLLSSLLQLLLLY